MKKIILSICIVLIAAMQVQAQNWDINTVKKVNGWKTHDMSRTFSHSGAILPVGVPAAMGIYALIKKDQPLLKDAVYIGTTVIEALGVTYALKYSIDRLRPYDKYPDRIHAIEKEDSPSFGTHGCGVLFGYLIEHHLPQVVCHRSFGLVGLRCGICTHQPGGALSE